MMTAKKQEEAQGQYEIESGVIHGEVKCLVPSIVTGKL